MKKLILILYIFIQVNLMLGIVADPFGQAVLYFGGTTISLKVQVNGQNASINDILIAYVDNEIRAKVALSAYPENIGGVGKTFIIQSNQADENVHFKLWRRGEQAVYSTQYAITSNPGSSIGTASSPIIINFNIRNYTISGTATENQIGLENISINIISLTPPINFSLYKPFKTNSDGYYVIPDINPESNINYYAYSTAYTLNPSNVTYNNIQNDIVANFTADPLPTYTISGIITSTDNTPIVNVSIANTTTDSNGFYSISVIQNNNITITPQKEGYNFSPQTISFTNVQNNITQNFTGEIQTFSITGTTDIDNVTINIQSNISNLPQNIISNSQGYYEISNIIYNDNIILIPEKEGYNFNPTNEYINNIQENTIINFSADPIIFNISGHITTDSFEILEDVLIKSEANTLATTDNTGFYSFEINYGTDISFYPEKTGYSFNPNNHQYQDIVSNQTQNFTATALPQYTISGFVTHNNIGLTNVNISFGNFGNTSTDNNGFYNHTIYQTNESFLVIPQKTGFNFTPGNYLINGINQDIIRDFTADIQTFSISGQVYSLPGTIIKAEWGTTLLQDISNQNGNYLIEGIPYGTSLILTATHPGYTFTPTQYSISNISNNLTSYNFSPEMITYPVIIHTSDYNGQNLSDVNITYNNISGSTNENGLFTFQGNWGQDYTITVSKPGHIFINSTQTISNLNSSIELDFITRVPNQYALNGYIEDNNNQALQNVHININQSIIITDSTGYFSETIIEGENLIITPQLTGYSFTPSSHSINNVNSNVTVNFIGTPNIYTINGYIFKDQQGLGNVTIYYNNNTTTSNQNGEFSVPVTYGQSITIFPEYTGHTFDPASINFANISSNIYGITFTAIANQYSIHGQVLCQGEPIQDVQIYDINSTRETFTDENGQYFFTAYHNENISLSAYKDWHSFNPEYYTLTVIQNETNIDFEATRHCADVGFSPSPGLYYEPINITLYSETLDVIIYYTTDGSEPNINSNIYTNPITLDYRSILNLKAKAIKSGYISSSTTEALYQVTGTVETPTFNINPSEYFTAQTIEIESEPNAQIYYTLNNNDPTPDDLLYIEPILIYQNTFIKAKAFKENFIESSTNSANYLITHLLDLNLPDTIYINENSSLTLNFKNYINDSVIIENDDIELLYEISQIIPSENIQTNINNNFVTFTPNQYWSGNEYLYFKSEFLNPQMRKNSNINYDIDSLNVIVNSVAPQIVSYTPNSDTLYISPENNYITFHLNVAQYGQPLLYEWYIDNTNQNNNNHTFSYTFSNYNSHIVKAKVSNDLSFSEVTWYIMSYVNQTDLNSQPFTDKLYSNYPNPFNPITNIEFSLLRDEYVLLQIFNLKGQLLTTLIDDKKSKGKHIIIWNAEKLPSGIYFISLKTDNYSEIKKAIILK